MAATVSKLERELQELRATIADTETEQIRQGELAEQAAKEREAAADDAAAFAAASSRIAEHRDEHARLGLVLERRQRELVALETRLEDTRYQSAAGLLGKAAERRQSATGSVLSALAAALETLPEPEAARADYDAALATAWELRPDDVELELPAAADEPEFPEGIEQLVEILKAGPRRPLADSVAARDRVEQLAEQRSQHEIRRAVEDVVVAGNFARIERLSPMQLDEARARVEERVEEELARRAQARGGAFAVTATGGRVDAALARRLDRVNELVDVSVG